MQTTQRSTRQLACLYFLSIRGVNDQQSKAGKKRHRARLAYGHPWRNWAALTVWASLWASPGRVYALNESGQTTVIETGEDGEVLGTNRIDGLYWSTPNVAGSTLLVRSANQLHCIGD